MPKNKSTFQVLTMWILLIWSIGRVLVEFLYIRMYAGAPISFIFFRVLGLLAAMIVFKIATKELGLIKWKK